MMYKTLDTYIFFAFLKSNASFGIVLNPLLVQSMIFPYQIFDVILHCFHDGTLLTPKQTYINPKID